VRYYLNNNYKWFKCEEILSQDTRILAYYAEDLHFKGLKQESYNIITRHNLLPMIVKQEVKAGYEQTAVIDNILYSQDCFSNS
jgi:hypothetical protein